MKITAVICEYNPFHRGHKLQIDSIKARGELALCIMSGGFVQRGIPALFDKYVRAESAVRCGADLVLELPYPFSCSSAEFFAKSGVALADSLGVVDNLCFGSECGDIERLETISDRLASPTFAEAFKTARADKNNRNLSYASLRSKVYEELYSEGVAVLPNDMLGVEYISALKAARSSIQPVTYKREAPFSATESRRLITSENSFDCLPDEVAELYKDSEQYRMEYAERAILAYYRSALPEEIKKYDGMTDGIADRLVRNAKTCTSLDMLIEKVGGKSYTNAKIRRCIINGMVGVTTDMLKKKPLFTNVLAFSGEGRKLIRRINKQGNISLLTKPAHCKRMKGDARVQADIALKADGLLTLMCENIKGADEFLTRSPFLGE
ncbi:MAG: nucleotidyltransferase family protein [Clostridia bacterium]|nr:nucleotidyltransferase family protein [Clostridia bacterium]